MRIAFTIPNRVFGIAALGAACFGAGLVFAAEFPASGSGLLTYSGRVTDSAGNPRTTTDSITVTLFDAESGGQSLCAGSEAAFNFGATRGNFAIKLPALCNEALAEAGDAWAEVTIDDTTLPRQKLGAVPFALVANQAINADFAEEAASSTTSSSAMLASAVAANGVGTAALQSESVVASKVAPGAIGSTHIGTGAVGSDELAANAVQTSRLADGSVTDDKLGPQSVTAAKLATDAVTGDKIAPGTIAGSDIAPGTVAESNLNTSFVASVASHETRLDTLDSVMTIAGGIVTQPHQPAATWRFDLNMPANETDGLAPVGNVLFDTTGALEVATGKFTAPVAGVYLVTGQWNSNGKGIGCVVAVRVVVNNVRFGVPSQVRAAVDSEPMSNGFSNTVKLAAGDYVKIRGNAPGCGAPPSFEGEFGVSLLY